MVVELGTHIGIWWSDFTWMYNGQGTTHTGGQDDQDDILSVIELRARNIPPATIGDCHPDQLST